MKKYLAYCLFCCFTLVLVMSGCSRKGAAPPGKSVVETNDRVTLIFERDTNIYSPEAAAGLHIPLSEVKQGLKPVKKSNKQATVTAQVVGNQLYVDCECDSVAIAAKIRDTETRQTSVKTVTETVQVKFIPLFVTVLAWIGGASILVGVFSALRLFKVL
ncbi:hypothetical protein D3C72_344450 [compost metagenome]